MKPDRNCNTSGFYGPSKQMSDTKPPTLTFANWLKALLLSPGTMFSAGYLVLFLLTNSYLDNTIKKNVSETFNRSTGHTWQLSVASIRSGYTLNSITLKQLSFIPSKRQSPPSAPLEPILIKELQVPCTHLCTLFFNRKQAAQSIRVISAHLLKLNPQLTQANFGDAPPQ